MVQGMLGRHTPEGTFSNVYCTHAGNCPKRGMKWVRGQLGTKKLPPTIPREGYPFVPLPHPQVMGLDQKLNWGRVVAAAIPQMSQDLCASPSPGMNAWV